METIFKILLRADLGVRSFHPADSSPQGRFIPRVIRPETIRHRSFVRKTFHLIQTLALFLLGEEDNSVPCKEKYVPMCIA